MKLAVLIVKLYEVVEKFFPAVKLAGYENARPVVFAPPDPLATFFHPLEIEKINAFKTFKRQVEWICGRLAIKKVYAVTTGSRLADHKILVDINSNGAPFLAAFPKAGISISHSQAYAMGALCMQPGVRLGVDLEKIDPDVSEDFLKVAFTRREMAVLRHCSGKRIFENWTKKEAFLKYIELGFRENLQAVEVLDDHIYYHRKPVTGLKIHSGQYTEDYAYSLICDKAVTCPVPELKILKTSALDRLDCTAVA